MRLAGKTAIITGAGKGIGRATACLFAQEGANVAVADIDEDAAADTVSQVRESGGKAIYTIGDVGIASDAERMVADTLAAFGQVDILINNAAIMAHGSVHEITEEAWDNVLRVDLKSVFLMSRCVLPHMLDRHSGSIVNVSSGAGLAGWYSQAAYDAAKGGVVNLTRQMALDYAALGVRVNCLVPAIIDTDQLRGAVAQLPDPEAEVEQLRSRVPLGRMGTAMEIAYGALFLASDEASYSVGAALVLDGGYLAR
jgi:NAD(P)-dependent dehydrogenase (short-subunit alcohol dehydrogenase family)